MRMTRSISAALAVLALAATAAHAQSYDFLVQAPRRAWLGFSYDAVSGTRAAPPTIIVRDVVSDSPAERAGLAVGDTITRINQINATEQFIASLGSALEPGDDVIFDVRRGGRARTLTITAAPPPAGYARFGPSAGLLRVDGDSIRSLVRVFVDSAFAGLDSMRVPDIYFRRGDGVWGLRGDSVFAFGDSVIWRGAPGDISVFRFDRDSLRIELDSLRTRLWSGDPVRFRFNADSIFGQAFIYSPGDSLFGAWRIDGTPYGFTMAGRSAIAGAELTRLDPAMEEYFGVREGVLVTRVPRDTPAARAGLQVGDVIVRVNGDDVDTVDELRRRIQRTPRDERARLEVVRRKQRVTVEIGTE